MLLVVISAADAARPSSLIDFHHSRPARMSLMTSSTPGISNDPEGGSFRVTKKPISAGIKNINSDASE
jgi:hypothetical protein